MSNRSANVSPFTSKAWLGYLFPSEKIQDSPRALLWHLLFFSIFSHFSVLRGECIESSHVWRFPRFRLFHLPNFAGRWKDTLYWNIMHNYIVWISRFRCAGNLTELEPKLIETHLLWQSLEYIIHFILLYIGKSR